MGFKMRFFILLSVGYSEFCQQAGQRAQSNAAGDCAESDIDGVEKCSPPGGSCGYTEFGNCQVAHSSCGRRRQMLDDEDFDSLDDLEMQDMDGSNSGWNG